MKRSKRRAVILSTLTVLGIALGVVNRAEAGWYNCPTATHVAFNPVTGNSMQVGHDERVFSAPDQAIYAWVCVTDGGLTGAHSVGTATYYLQGGGPTMTQHSPICTDATGPGCTETYIGASLRPPVAGAIGAQQCVSPVVAQSSPCVSAGMTPGSSPPVTTSVHNPAPGGQNLCVSVTGTCAVQAAEVTVGGTIATVYVDATPTHVTVPAITVCTNWTGPSGYIPASVNLGTTC